MEDEEKISLGLNEAIALLQNQYIRLLEAMEEISLMIEEINLTIDKFKNQKENKVYESVGGYLVEKDKASVLKDLEEKRERLKKELELYMNKKKNLEEQLKYLADISKKIEETRRVFLSYDAIITKLNEQLNNMNNAIEELKKLDENKKVYKIIEDIIIEADKNSLINELEEKMQDIKNQLEFYKKKRDDAKNELTNLLNNIKNYQFKSI